MRMIVKCPICKREGSLYKMRVKSYGYWYVEHYRGGATKKCYVGRKLPDDLIELDKRPKLKSDDKVISMRLEAFMERKLTLPELERFLWRAADILRGAVEAPDYKHYILPLFFFKRLSDVYLEEHDELLKKYRDEEIARELHAIKIPEGCFWDDMRKVSKNVGAKLNDVLDRVAKVNPELDGVINRTDFNAPDRLPPDRLFRLIEHFSILKLGNRDVDPDVLGRAYEYLIRQFALLEARKGGEFYTPREVVRTLVKILDPREGNEVYDPCCGSGGMLIHSHYHLKEKGEDPKRLFLYGQELQVFICAIAKMNILLHNMEAEIRHGDTFADPKFLEPDGSLKKFDIVIANPMWNQDGYRDAMESDKFGRFVYGIAPNNSADWGWIQHMLASLKPNGRMGIVLDRGSLFRGGSEGKIRKKVIEEEDLVECIVHLPEKIFYNTGAPGCLLILNRNKAKEREGKVLFIYAEGDYGKHDELKRMNKLREEDIKKVVSAYRKFKDVPKYAKVASLGEIRENDYNLSVTRYVDVFEEEVQVDVPRVLGEMEKTELERSEVEGRLEKHLAELGYKHESKVRTAKTGLDLYLEEIKNRIVQAFNPVKIILFGSYAWGTPKEDSDLDLLVILETDESPVKRIVRVSRLFRDRKLPMDILVKTPQEIEERLRIGDPFFKEVLEKGRLIYERSS